MQSSIPEEQIRTVAYRLWEEAGCPEGQAEEFWERARQELGVNGPTNNARAIEPAEELDARDTPDGA
ncbi:hypothetical protein AWB76_06775 [Caballeronia temeraria]|uniref:DUF2934 domain-containing protein n=1 Tax=Caballeronia temeraria TaxID=1777137 RepID=A0A158DC96_9BURK|nr:DUF2934 domain-containing protein [Caballeronia temeraria]SAK92178.1 hypothetical protein AWB76_06775 [Caballeronia temeraria]